MCEKIKNLAGFFHWADPSTSEETLKSYMESHMGGNIWSNQSFRSFLSEKKLLINFS